MGPVCRRRGASPILSLWPAVHHHFSHHSRSRRQNEAPVGTIVLILSILAAIGAWAGWSLGTRLVNSHSSGAFDPPGPKIWRMAFAISLGLLSVIFGILLLTYLDA